MAETSSSPQRDKVTDSDELLQPNKLIESVLVKARGTRGENIILTMAEAIAVEKFVNQGRRLARLANQHIRHLE